jgi:hypothetical protein
VSHSTILWFQIVTCEILLLALLYICEKKYTRSQLALPNAHDGPLTFVAMAHLELTRGCGGDGGVGGGMGSSGGGGGAALSLPAAAADAAARQHKHGGGGGERKQRAMDGSGGFDDLLLTGGADGTPFPPFAPFTPFTPAANPNRASPVSPASNRDPWPLVVQAWPSSGGCGSWTTRRAARRSSP